MAKTVYIILTLAGTDTGPFNLYSNEDGFTLPFESSIDKPTLEAGYTSVLVPDNTTTIRVCSVNPLCTNCIDLEIQTTTTTSTSSTSTSTSTTTSTSTSTTTSTSTSTTTSTTTTADPTADVAISLNISLDVTITQVEVNNVNVTVISGSLPNTPGNTTNTETNQLGTFDIEVHYTSSIAGQHITLIGSDSTVYCLNTSGSGTFLFPAVVVNSSNPVIIEAADGTC